MVDPILRPFSRARAFPLDASRVLTGIFLCALLASVVRPEVQAETRSRLAVWDFDDASFVADSQTTFMRRALPEMLLSELGQTQAVRLVDRVHLIEALEEQNLALNGLVEENSRIKLGKIVGAGQMVFGNYMAIGNQIRIDVRLVDVETSLILLSESSTTALDQVADSMRKIAVAIAQHNGGGAQSNPLQEKKMLDLDLWKEYEKGIEQMDRRDFEQAIGIFQSILKRFPEFTPAEKQLRSALLRMSRQ